MMSRIALMMMMMIMIMMLLSTVSSLSLSSLLRSSLVIPIISFSFSVNAVDLDNGSKLFQLSCSSCHAGGGNVTPFSSGKTLSLSDLKSNGYDTVDNVISIVNKVNIYYSCMLIEGIV